MEESIDKPPILWFWPIREEPKDSEDGEDQNDVDDEYKPEEAEIEDEGDEEIEYEVRQL